MAYYKCGSIHPTQNSNVVVDTASGAIANFQTPLAIPLKSLTIGVNAKQNLHGYSYPWPAGGGKNLININGIVNSEQKNPTDVITLANGMVIKGVARNGYLRPTNVTTVVDANSITVTSTNDVYGVGYVFACKEGQDYCFSSAIANTRNACTFYGSNGVFISGSNFNIGTQVYTAPENAVYGIIIIYPSAADTPTTCAKPQLEKGSTATEYAPYENICPISGVSEIGVIHCHKNLFQYDENRIAQAKTSAQTTRAYYNLGFKNCTIAFSGSYKSGITPDSTRLNIGKLNNGVLTVLTEFIKEDAVNDKVVTFGADDTAVIMYNAESTVSFKTAIEKFDLQLEISSQSSSFEPYNGSTTLINLGGTYYGGYVSQDKDGKRELVVTHKLLDWSTSNFRRSNNSGNWTNYLFFASVSDMKYNYLQKSDIYEIQFTGNVGDIENYRFRTSFSGSIPYVYFRNDDYTDVDDFVTAMNEHQFLYEITEPFTIALPDGQPIKSLPGVNNIFSDTGDTSLQFAKIGN